jgi:PAS domain S-box-containing protein
MAESVLSAFDGENGRAPAQACPALPGVEAADLFLELLEAERLLEELIEAEEGAPLDEARRLAMRRHLRLAAGELARVSVPTELPPPVDHRVAALLEELPEAIMLVDEEDRVRYANGRVREVYGLEPAGATGRNLADVMTAPGVLLRVDDPSAFVEATLRLLRRSGEPCEDLFRHRDGPSFLRRSAPVGNAGRFGRLLITTNVTALRERNRCLGGQTEPAPSSLSDDTRQARPHLRLVAGGRTD